MLQTLAVVTRWMAVPLVTVAAGLVDIRLLAALFSMGDRELLTHWLILLILFGVIRSLG